MTVKAAVLASGRYEPDRIFPDYFAAPDAEKAEEEALARGDDVVLDYSDVDWELPSENGESPEDMLALLNTMGANLSLTVDDDDWQPTPPPGSENLDQVDDREWS